MNTNVMTTFFLSWIKNFTLDCTRYYDKLFTYSDINFFLKAATDTMYFIFSNNTQTILAIGLGTCQEKQTKKQKQKKRFLCRKLYQTASNFFLNGFSDRRATHSVAWETTLNSKVPKTTINVALNNKFYTSEQQLACQSSMSVNCAD